MRTTSRSARRLALVAAATALLTSGCTAREAYEDSMSFGIPHPASEQAKAIYDVWLGTTACGVAVGVFVWALIGYAIVRFRRRGDELPPQVRYNLPIEVLYTALPFVIIAVLFYYTAIGENKVNDVHRNPDVTIGVVGFQWNWQFNYMDDKVQVTGEPDHPATLVVPVNKRILFLESSPDVIHSFWLPEWLFKRDVIPGRLNSFEIKPTKTGTYTGRCAEFCGEKHDRMNFVVKVVSDADYQTYIDGLKADPNAAPNSLSAAIPTKDN